MESHQHSRTPGPDILEKERARVSKEYNIYGIDECPHCKVTKKKLERQSDKKSIERGAAKLDQ